MATPIERDVRDKMERLSNLPSIPQVILKIRQISENPKSSTADLANVILSDHQLTARILRMANSVYYAEFPGTVSSITHAIVLMGFRAVRNIAISTAVYGAFSRLSQRARFDVVAFWTRSLTVGVIAKQLAGSIRQTEMIEAAFIGGFIHDIGQIILASVFPDKYGDISRAEAEDETVYKLERALIGLDHLEAGEFVAKKWNLPVSLLQAISHHHRLDKPANERSDHVLADIVFVADRIYEILAHGLDSDSPEFKQAAESASTLLDVPSDELRRILLATPEMVVEIADDLGVEIERCVGDDDDDLDELLHATENEENDPLVGELELESSFAKKKLTDIHVSEITRKLNQKDTQLSFLQNASTALAEAHNDDEVLQIMCEAIYSGLRMGRVILFEFDLPEVRFLGKVGFGVESQEQVKNYVFTATEGMFFHIRDTGSPIHAESLEQRLYGSVATRQAYKAMGIVAFALVPIKILNDVRYAIFAEAPNRAEPLDDDVVKSISALTAQASLTLERNLYKSKSGD